MEFLTALWLPIVLSSVVVFVASFVAWMVLPHHKSDWTRLPSEDEFMKNVKDLHVPQGSYMFPYAASPDDWKSEEFKKKYEQGPTGVLCVWGKTNMAANLLLTFLFYLVTSIFVGYLSHSALSGSAEAPGFLRVFQIAGTVALMAYCFAIVPQAIWFKQNLLTNLADGVVFGLVTGLIFGLFAGWY